MYANIDSMFNKGEDLFMLVAAKDPDLILLTEFLPKNKGIYESSEFEICGYETYLSSITKGRGVAIYCKIGLSVNMADTITCENFQKSLWCRMKLKQSDSLLIGYVYRSPASDVENNVMLNDLLRKVISLSDSHLLIVGDFNFREINWSLRQSDASYDHDSSKFIEAVNDCYLFQHISEPTRFREERVASILDLVFSNEELMVSDIHVEYLPPNGKRDHVTLSFIFNCYAAKETSNSEPRYLYHKGDYEKLRQLVGEINWTATETLDVDDHWDVFTKSITSSVDKCIPKSKPGSFRKKKWVTTKALQAIKDNQKAWKKYT